MHSISAILIKLFTKPFIKAGAKLICISLLFITQTAHADFRKALDAYQARDGATMLKEVKDAVDKKNDDGLILFLMLLRVDIESSQLQRKNNQIDKNSNLQPATSTYLAILNDSQFKDMSWLLDLAVASSSAHNKFMLNDMPHVTVSELKINQKANFERLKKNAVSQDELLNFFNQSKKESTEYLETLGNQGSIYAAANLYVDPDQMQGNYKEKATEWLTKAAKLGYPEAQLILGLKYLNMTASNIGLEDCTQPRIAEFSVCLEKNIDLGKFWLKEAAKGYGRYVMLDSTRSIADYASLMGKLTSDKKYPATYDLEQAKLWYLVAISSPSSSPGLYVASLNELGCNKNCIDSYLKLAKPKYPKWLVEATKQEGLPIFSYVSKQVISYSLDVYANGMVKISIGGFELGEKAPYLQLKPMDIQNFVNDIKKMGFMSMPAHQPAFDTSYICVNICLPSVNLISILREGNQEKRVYIGITSADKLNVNRKIQDVIKIDKVVEKYFPTKRLRCDIGSSEYFKANCNNSLDNRANKKGFLNGY